MRNVFARAKPPGQNVLAIVTMFALGSRLLVGLATPPTTQRLSDYQAIKIASKDSVWQLVIYPDGSARLVFGAALGRDLPLGTYDYKALRGDLREGGASGFHVSFDPEPNGPAEAWPPQQKQEQASEDSSRIRALFETAFKAAPMPGQARAVKDTLECLNESPLLPPRPATSPTIKQVASCKQIRIVEANDLNLYIWADGSGALFHCKLGMDLFPGFDKIGAREDLGADKWNAAFLKSMRGGYPNIGPGVTFPTGTFDFERALRSLHDGAVSDYKVSFVPKGSGFNRDEHAPDEKQLDLLLDKSFFSTPDSGQGDLSVALMRYRGRHTMPRQRTPDSQTRPAAGTGNGDVAK